MISKDDFYHSIGDTIRQLRKSNNLSQQELASAIDLTRSSLAQIESADQAISAYHLYKVSRVLGIDLCEVMNKTIKEPPSFDKESATRINPEKQDEIINTLDKLRAKEV